VCISIGGSKTEYAARNEFFENAGNLEFLGKAFLIFERKMKLNEEDKVDKGFLDGFKKMFGIKVEGEVLTNESCVKIIFFLFLLFLFLKVIDRFFEFKVMILLLYGHIYKGQALNGQSQTNLTTHMTLIFGGVNKPKFKKYSSIVMSAFNFLSESDES
jgi:hypothetical protein